MSQRVSCRPEIHAAVAKGSVFQRLLAENCFDDDVQNFRHRTFSMRHAHAVRCEAPGRGHLELQGLQEGCGRWCLCDEVSMACMCVVKWAVFSQQGGADSGPQCQRFGAACPSSTC